MSAPITTADLPPQRVEATTTQGRHLAGGGDVVLAGARVSGIVLTAVSSAVVARALGPHSYGVFAAGAGVAALIVLGKTFGADSLFQRGSISEREFKRRAWAAGGANLLLVALAAALWPGLTTAARGCELLMGAASAVGFARTPWQVIPARQLQFAVRARRELLANAVSLGAVMVLAVVFKTPLLAATGLFAGNLLFFLLSWPSVRRETSSEALATEAPVRAGLPFISIEALFVAYFSVDGAMIAAMRAPVDAGIYRVAYAFVIAAAVVPVALNADVLRVRLWQLSGVAQRQAWRRAVTLTAIAAVAVTAGFELFAGVAVHAFFGARFAAAIPVVRLLGAAMPFHFANSLFSNRLVGAGRTSTVIRIQVAMLAVNVVGNLFLIPAHGPSGAAAMTAVTEALGTALFLALSLRSPRVSSIEPQRP